ncbi:unnamed protein product [Prunus armeniaca]|uniref:Uncharacterized protein n=1 Tax=Prunus armeniaca TaxID=36596 RepID=A0A6J5V5G6_PRUAR|nr:hypothetical protein GBA52_020798 [Prunus armeniaca]CAB4282934.1 unnamed protein product [Prunus armeniaca]CAB4313359.1 unnamed protein product [Prunus armeniaca]
MEEALALLMCSGDPPLFVLSFFMGPLDLLTHQILLSCHILGMPLWIVLGIGLPWKETWDVSSVILKMYLFAILARSFPGPHQLNLKPKLSWEACFLPMRVAIGM